MSKWIDKKHDELKAKVKDYALWKGVDGKIFRIIYSHPSSQESKKDHDELTSFLGTGFNTNTVCQILKELAEENFFERTRKNNASSWSYKLIKQQCITDLTAIPSEDVTVLEEKPEEYLDFKKVIPELFSIVVFTLKEIKKTHIEQLKFFLEEDRKRQNKQFHDITYKVNNELARVGQENDLLKNELKEMKLQLQASEQDVKSFKLEERQLLRELEEKSKNLEKANQEIIKSKKECENLKEKMVTREYIAREIDKFKDDLTPDSLAISYPELIKMMKNKVEK